MNAATMTNSARWSLDGYAQVYSWPQCHYCGRAQNHDCARVACMLCGTFQCFGNGSGNGHCAICHHGYLPGWSRSYDAKHCAYKGCEAEAVGSVGKRPICADHAHRAKASKVQTVAEYMVARLTDLEAGQLKIGFKPWRLVP